MKSSPLNHIKIASPCPADWNEMRGNKQKRFCTHCQLCVYNLSEMTERDAENLLFESEGKICVRLYRREDGTVITQNCPVGWQAVKQKVSRVATAVFGLLVGFCGGLYASSQLSFDREKLLEETTIETEVSEIVKPLATEGMVSNFDEIKNSKKSSKKEPIEFSVNGSISNGPDLMWIFTERYPK
jgi:hypothetical protein